MIVVGALIALVLIVFVVSRLAGSSTSGTATTPVVASGAEHSTQTTSAHTAAEASSPAVSPSETSVTVLNGTETPELAHRLAESLQQNGYSRAVALGGTPPGTHSVSVVEYASGHRAEAQAVAKASSVADVRPMESSVASLSNAANVVLVVGADKASTTTSSSTAEPAGGSAENG
jgi:hypothetical protein